MLHDIHPDNPLLGPQSRADFITQNLRLVYKIAHRFRQRAEALNIPFEDVIGEGTIGLILAYDRYSDAKFAFSSMAGPYISGFILNLFRTRGDDVRIPRRLYNVMQRILREGLENTPTAEVAQHLEVSIRLAHEAKYCAHVRRADSLDAYQESDDDRVSREPGVTFDDTEPDVAAFINALSPRQQEITRLLMRGYTQVEIAKMVGSSRQAVSKTVERIRAQYERLNPAAA